MLNTQKNILNSSPPFLMQTAIQEWMLIESVSIDAEQYNLAIIEKNNGVFKKRTIQLAEPPFYIGAEIWELDYGATLMTLYHDSLVKHPAKKLWMEWLNIQA